MAKAKKEGKFAAFFRHGFDPITPIDLKASSALVVHLSDGGKVEVELFERTTGRLTIRTSGGGVIIHPRVINVIEIEAEYKGA